MTKRYSRQFSNKAFWKKITSLPGTYRELRYRAKLLWYLLQDPDVPKVLKASVIAALGYLICPVDAIPDAIPVGGFVDDMAVVTALLKSMEAYITPSMRRRASQ